MLLSWHRNSAISIIEFPGQMLSKSKTPVQPLYGPGSNKVIPPSPAFITQRCGSNIDVKSDVRPVLDVRSS